MLPVILSLALLPALCLAFGSAQVYLHPSVAFAPQAGAQARLAYHLGLDAYEALPPEESTGETVLGGSNTFVGEGRRDTLLVSVDTNHPDDILPQSLQLSFVLPINSYSISSTLERYARLARKTFDSVSDSSTPVAPQFTPKFLDIMSLSASSSTVESEAVEMYLKSLSGAVMFVEETQEDGMADRFGAFEVTGLKDIEKHWGRESETYVSAAAALKATIQSAIANGYTLAVLIPSNMKARRLAQPPQTPFPSPNLPSSAPVFSTSTCFANAATCQNATASCSSRGECVNATRAGRSCFVCQCRKAPLKEGGRSIFWAGEMCQKQDVSQEFVLIVGTVLGLVLIVAGAIGLLYTIGDQELPGTLTGGLSGHIKAE